MRNSVLEGFRQNRFVVSIADVWVMVIYVYDSCILEGVREEIYEQFYVVSVEVMIDIGCSSLSRTLLN